MRDEVRDEVCERMDNDLAKSMARLGDLVGQSKADLYDDSTCRGRRSVLLMQELCGRVALVENVSSQTLWPQFAQWVQKNPVSASKIATIWTSDWIVSNSDRLMMAAAWKSRASVLKKWGVKLDDSLVKKIDVLKVKWNEEKEQRRLLNLADKNFQTAQLLTHWESILQLLTSDAKEFCQIVDEEEAILFKKGRHLWSTLKKMSDSAIQCHMLSARAILSFGRSTGCRGKHILTANLEHFRVLDDNRLRFRYFCDKNGRRSKVSRPIHVVLQFHSNPSLCGILHLAQFVVFSAYVLKQNAEKPFYFDVNFNVCKTELTRYHHVFYRASTIIQRSTVAAGVRDVNNKPYMGRNKLHVMRSICNDLLIQGGVDKLSRREFCGWSSGDVDGRYYSNPEHIAISSSAPKVLAQGDPHRAWENLNGVPQQVLEMLLSEHQGEVMVFFRKIILVALAAGLCQSSFSKYFKDITKHSQFKVYKTTVTPSLKKKRATTLPPNGETGCYLKRRIVELTTALAMERAENKRLRAVYGGCKDPRKTRRSLLTLSPEEAKNKLNGFVLEITKGSVLDLKSTSWLRLCYDTVTNEIVPHISRYSENDSFIVTLASSEGKRLMAVLMLAAAFHTFGENKLSEVSVEFTKRQTWLGFFAKHRKSSYLFSSFKTDCWSSFLMSSELDKPTATVKEVAL